MSRNYHNDIRLIQFQTFNSEFEKLLPTTNNFRDAFQNVESKIGRHYSSYESFRNSRYKHLNKKCK